MTADSPQSQASQEYIINPHRKEKLISSQYSNLTVVTSDIESKEVLNFPLKDLSKDYIELSLEYYLAQTPYNFPLPSTPMTSTTSPDSSKESNGKNQNIDLVQVINLIFTSIQITVALVAILIGTSVALYVSLSNKIDNGLQEIREEAREDRKLIISANKDFNNRIDITNQRIDQVYQSPSIKSS